ncbi:MAG: hypothetical protein Q7T04_07970 [Dehalococcoidia bacterium]|nr:hypothetical protein [Dehalococcoidia bacterium]
MESGTILKIVAIGMLHWMLAPLALDNLARRPRVLGGHKVPWTVCILFLTCFGSLFYLVLHPQPQTAAQTESEYRWP